MPWHFILLIAFHQTKLIYNVFHKKLVLKYYVICNYFAIPSSGETVRKEVF